MRLRNTSPTSPPPPAAKAVQNSQPSAGVRAAGKGWWSANGTVIASAPSAVSRAAAHATTRATLRRIPSACATSATTPGPDMAATAAMASNAGTRGVHSAASAGMSRASPAAPSATTANTGAAEPAARSHTRPGIRRT